MTWEDWKNIVEIGKSKTDQHSQSTATQCECGQWRLERGIMVIKVESREGSVVSLGFCCFVGFMFSKSSTYIRKKKDSLGSDGCQIEMCTRLTWAFCLKCRQLILLQRTPGELDTQKDISKTNNKYPRDSGSVMSSDCHYQWPRE